MRRDEFKIVDKLVNQEITNVLNKIKSKIELYEADCRLADENDECAKCNDNVFKSIYHIIDEYIKDNEK